MLQPEHHKPPQVPSVVARLKNSQMSRNTFSSGYISLTFPPINPLRTDTQTNVIEQSIIIDLYVTTERINDQNKFHWFTSHRCTPGLCFNQYFNFHRFSSKRLKPPVDTVRLIKITSLFINWMETGLNRSASFSPHRFS